MYLKYFIDCVKTGFTYLQVINQSFLFLWIFNFQDFQFEPSRHIESYPKGNYSSKSNDRGNDAMEPQVRRNTSKRAAIVFWPFDHQHTANCNAYGAINGNGEGGLDEGNKGRDVNCVDVDISKHQ